MGRPKSPLEQNAREINAEPWEPLPGMVKHQCPDCRYFFAAPHGSQEELCPDCVEQVRHKENARIRALRASRQIAEG